MDKELEKNNYYSIVKSVIFQLLFFQVFVYLKKIYILISTYSMLTVAIVKNLNNTADPWI